MLCCSCGLGVWAPGRGPLGWVWRIGSTASSPNPARKGGGANHTPRYFRQLMGMVPWLMIKFDEGALNWLDQGELVIGFEGVTAEC